METFNDRTCHNMSLDKKWYTHIEEGNKIMEGRFYDDKRRTIKINDGILFECEGQSIIKTVFNIIIFENLETCISKLIEDNILNLLLPGCKSYEEAIDIYLSIPGYMDKNNKYNFMLIVLE